MRGLLSGVGDPTYVRTYVRGGEVGKRVGG
jgi:hypothetical protein